MKGEPVIKSVLRQIYEIRHCYRSGFLIELYGDIAVISYIYIGIICERIVKVYYRL